ncbi:hypothetical protein FHS85_005121 [Rhodoligotrophos appendicifer]|uniref:sulfotransferase domain-containing protein n=1 Tax=Rhodoligotrophos appendicifer TaxID=987056 RepID=UPI00117C50A1|nr:sulfotransferase domain-containing protein [Rhodoligotrophos appendicifer]
MQKALSLVPQLLHSKKARKNLKQMLNERRLLKEADFVCVSFPKSGRTWLRAMLTRLYQVRYDLPDGLLIGYSDLHRLNPRIPNIFFTHDCLPLGGVASLDPDKTKYRRSRVFFLGRHPIDVVVSQYHQITMRGPGKRENLSGGKDLFTFATEPGFGIHTIIAYENHWLEASERTPGVLVAKYEEIRQEPETELARVTSFLGERFSADEIAEAVEFCAFENLQRREREHYYVNSGLRPTDPSDPRSFKVRRGKMHGYLDYFDTEQLAVLKKIVDDQLDPRWNYEVALHGTGDREPRSTPATWTMNHSPATH